MTLRLFQVLPTPPHSSFVLSFILSVPFKFVFFASLPSSFRPTLALKNMYKVLKKTWTGQTIYINDSFYLFAFNYLLSYLFLFLISLQAERDLALELLDAANFDATFSDILEQPIDILATCYLFPLTPLLSSFPSFPVLLFDLWYS